jgi:hypothetical protein
VVAVALALVAFSGAPDVSGGEKPKYTISQVMKKAHSKGGLKDKVISGDADKKEKETLLAMYEALSKNTPPKGDADDWKAKTGALVAAAKLAVADDKGAVAALKKAVNCGACHKLHK